MSISGSSPQPAAATQPERSCGRCPLTAYCYWPASACYAPDHASRRTRAVLWAAFILGIAVSLAANIAAAPNLGWQPILVAGWPPVALLLASNYSPTTQPTHPPAQLHRRTQRPVTGNWRPCLPRTRPVV
jgi:multisubunit Na+/H+ antiporter MnhB subunit